MIALPFWKTDEGVGTGDALSRRACLPVLRLQIATLADALITRYAAPVTEKEVTEFGSSICTRRTGRHAAIFSFVHAFVRLLWAAVVGSLRAAGCLVRRSSNPAICRPPRLEARGGYSTVQGGSHA